MTYKPTQAEINALRETILKASGITFEAHVLENALTAAAAVREEWRPIESAPKEWEGCEVWWWSEWDFKGVRVELMPVGFSRKSEHCEGIFVQEYRKPAPPKGHEHE